MNDNKLAIRFATKKDVPLILGYIKQLAEYEKMLDLVVADESILSVELFEKKHAEVLLAEYDGQNAGFALFFHNFSTFLGRSGIYLEDLYVRPEFRSKGIGKSLIFKLAAIAKERKCGRLEWWCLDWNKSSIDFYKSLGAKAMSDWTVYRIDGKTLSDMGNPLHS